MLGMSIPRDGARAARTSHMIASVGRRTANAGGRPVIVSFENL
jgi:hypothetical protein